VKSGSTSPTLDLFFHRSSKGNLCDRTITAHYSVAAGLVRADGTRVTSTHHKPCKMTEEL
jgi:hypothetical protein